MAHAIFAGEIHIGFLGDFLGDKFIQCGDGAIGQEHRAGLRVERFNVAHAVVFLVRAGELVLLDDVLQVFLDARGGDEADLRVTAHDLAVKVEARLRVLLERALSDEFGEVLFTLRVDGV